MPKNDPHRSAWNATVRAADAQGYALLFSPVTTPAAYYNESNEFSPYQIVRELMTTQLKSSTRRNLRTALQKIKLSGYQLPLAWREQSPSKITSELAWLENWATFPLVEYLDDCRSRLFLAQNAGVPPGLQSLLCFFPHYFRYLAEAPHVLELPRLRDDTLAFPARPVVDQLTEVMLRLLHLSVFDQGSRGSLERLIDSGAPQVQEFADKHLVDLFHQTGLHPKHFLQHNKGTKIEQDFIRACSVDAENFKLQELLSRNHDDELSVAEFAVLNNSSVANTSPSADVFSRIASFQPNPAPAASPTDDDDRHFSTIAPGDREILLQAAKNSRVITEAGQKRRVVHHGELLNRLTAPLLTWFLQDRQLLPTLPYPEERVQNQHRLFRFTRTAENNELKDQPAALDKLARATTRESVDRLVQSVKFASDEAAARWQKAVSERRRTLRNTEQYRAAKIVEYGMEEFHGEDHFRDLYLDEILRVEEEVTTFVPYVRAAFSAALPVGSDLKWNSYRHSIDRPEFDPDTLTQPEKYLRGEVMRTFTEKQRRVPIAQVNALCLDYSKSMTHEPMRNLYKLVFLIVLGLESRKTYDAIYFFGSDFFTVIDFGEDYTSRKVLYRILRAVTTISGRELRYGGKGYTNISAGIEGSADRIMEFADTLATARPDRHLVRSLFVLTDGEPTGGIYQPDILREFIEDQRRGGKLAIKGIFLNTGDDVGDTIRHIFRPEHTVVTDNFEDAVVTFVNTMASTYREQRRAYREELRRLQKTGQL